MLIANYILPPALQIRIRRLATRMQARLPIREPEDWTSRKALTSRVRLVLNGAGQVADVDAWLVVEPDGDADEDDLEIPVYGPPYALCARTAWARRVEELWLWQEVARRAVREGRELAGLSGGALDDLIAATWRDARSYYVWVHHRSRWMLHVAALHEHDLRGGRELSAHERAREFARAAPLRQQLDEEVRAAVAWWLTRPAHLREGCDDLGTDAAVEHQVHVHRATLALAAEERADAAAEWEGGPSPDPGTEPSGDGRL